MSEDETDDENDDFEDGDENAADTNKDSSDLVEDDDNSNVEDYDEQDALEHGMGGARRCHNDRTTHPSIVQEKIILGPMHGHVSKPLPSATSPQQPLPSTPIPQRPFSAEMIRWQRIEPNKSPCSSPATIPPSSSPSPPLFTTPAPAGRKRARVVDGKSSGGGSPRARSPCVAGVTPSPASGSSSSSKRRKKRTIGTRVGTEAGVHPQMSPAVISGRNTPASAAKIIVNGTTEKLVWRVPDPCEKRGRSTEDGDVGVSKITVSDSSVDDGGALGGLAAAAVALAEAAAAGGGGRVALDLDKELVESARIDAEDGDEAQRLNPRLKDSGDKETPAGPDTSAGQRGGSAYVASLVYAMQRKGSGAGESVEKKKRSAGAGSDVGVEGKGVPAGNKRLGKKRVPEDNDKGAEDESTEEEGKVGKRQP